MDPLDRIVTLGDFEPLARAAMDPAAFDYVAGGAWEEITLAENEAAWRRRRFRPRVLADVSGLDPSTTLLGARASMPVAVAPMAAHALAHPDGEVATARAAAAAGVPFILSTMSSRSIEEVAGAAPDGTNWFQLYTQAEPGRSRALVERAAAAGYGAIVLTVDLPILGYRERDRRSGFDLPGPHGNFADTIEGATHAGGAHATVVHADVVHATHAGGVPASGARAPEVDASGYGLLDERLETGLTWSDVPAIRAWSSLPLVLKGILTVEDARLAVEHGADGIVVSNHGARQLDRVPAPIDVLAEIVDAVAGRAEVWVDGGVRRGLDVAIALALGARGVLVGRPVLWALAAGGQAGVERALAILDEELRITMALLGAATPADVARDHLMAVP